VRKECVLTRVLELQAEKKESNTSLTLFFHCFSLKYQHLNHSFLVRKVRKLGY